MLYICQTLVNRHRLHGKVCVQGLRERRRNHWDVSFQQTEQTVRGFPQSEAKQHAVNNLTDRNTQHSVAAGRANNLWDLLWPATPLTMSLRGRHKHIHAHITHALCHIYTNA